MFGVVALAAFTAAAEPTAITNAESAMEAAKRYTKASCTGDTRCTYKPERDGKQWRVWVRMTKREGTRSTAAGSLVLYFDRDGNLLRRLEAD